MIVGLTSWFLYWLSAKCRSQLLEAACHPCHFSSVFRDSNGESSPPTPQPKEMFLTSFASPPVGSGDEVGPAEDNLPYIKVRCFGTFLVQSPFSAAEVRVNTWKKVCRHRRWKSSGHRRLLPPSCGPL